jgi:uncharacterized protein YndB with AHSA1/START domain
VSTRIYNAIVVACSVERVFDYATTPAQWPQWHPSSLKLYGDAAHSLERGEKFEEDVRAGGRKGHLKWNVLERKPAQQWIAEAQVDNGASLVLTYKVSAHEGGCLFERELSYQLPNAFLRVLNKLILQRRIERESAESLAHLKAVLEKSG